MHFRSRRRRLASVTCFAAMTFSYEGSSLLFCKSITWCPLTKAVFFVFTVEINYFYLCIYCCQGNSCQSFRRKRCCIFSARNITSWYIQLNGDTIANDSVVELNV